MDEEDYGDIADEDLIEAFSQASQTLPPHLPSPRLAKRRRISDEEIKDNGQTNRHQRRSHVSTEDGASNNEREEETPKTKKPKYKIHVAAQAVSPAKIIGATQAEALLNSSPYRMRGPIFKNPRPKPPNLSLPPAHQPAPRSSIFQPRNNPPHPQENDFDMELDLNDLPSDAFSSLEKVSTTRDPINIVSSPLQVAQASQVPQQRLVAPSRGLRQITLFGGVAQNEPPASQTKKVLNYKQDKPPEAPTHHALDNDALQTWVFPTNLGAIRDYQYSIIRNGLFNNLLVALPTGLGKTFIAATIMLNFFRWTKSSQIVFVAPTKPLVAQQVDACFNIAGIPRSQTTMLTGEQAPAIRAEEWANKRVFFMTPQTLHNDLATGIADPKRIVLLVVDEAHRATGNYSYVTVVQFLRRFNKSFRILALTATPGASVEAVQEVIDNLEISKVEIRTEESMDIQQFIHRRDIDQILLDPSDEIIMVKELFAKTLQPLVNLLCSQSAYWNRDPMALTPWGLMQARKSWIGSDAGRRANPGLKGMVNGLFSILASIAHSIKLLNLHGIGPFYSSINDFRQGVEDANKPGKYRSQIVDNADFKKMMNMIKAWINKDDFVGHPKLTYLCDSILNHFLDAGEGRHGEDAPPSATRVIVFAEFRDSAEEIARVLNKHGPLIRASVFVGQADSKRSEGMNQAKQLETIRNFKAGKVNVIVATSIGEEGLDIGQVDLIVCYDASASPIRMLQRMGRTGRKRAGNIILLLMRGKEEESFAKAKDNYEQMQKMISCGTRFNFRHDLSVRIVPRDIVPKVDKRIIEIPLENTQGPALPEPKRRPTKPKKKPAKKFHMPDGVETGFKLASKLSGKGNSPANFGIITKGKKADKIQLLPIPSPESVFLSEAEELELERRYQNIAGNDLQEVSMPDMTVQTVAQRSLRPIGIIAHGQYTRRCVKLFKALSEDTRFDMPHGDQEQTLSYLNPPALVDESSVGRPQTCPTKSAPTKKPILKKKSTKPSLIVSDIESEDDENDHAPARRSGQEISGDDTEGEGDDLINSEESSEEDSSDCGSLKDFIADGSSQAFDSQTIIRSSTTPPSTKTKAFSAQATDSIETNMDDAFPYVLRLTPETGAPSETATIVGSDDIIVPSRGRKDKKRVVQDSDSDE